MRRGGLQIIEKLSKPVVRILVVVNQLRQLSDFAVTAVVDAIANVIILILSIFDNVVSVVMVIC